MVPGFGINCACLFEIRLGICIIKGGTRSKVGKSMKNVQGLKGVLQKIPEPARGGSEK